MNIFEIPKLVDKIISENKTEPSPETPDFSFVSYKKYTEEQCKNINRRLEYWLSHIKSITEKDRLFIYNLAFNSYIPNVTRNYAREITLKKMISMITSSGEHTLPGDADKHFRDIFNNLGKDRPRD